MERPSKHTPVGEGEHVVPRLGLSARAVGAICRHVEATYPEEACGGLLGLEDGEGHIRVLAALQTPNAREAERESRYLVGPASVLALERCAQAAGLEVLGYYHSHPDGHPLPSTYDRDHAWPWYTYLIVSVSLGCAVGWRAWRLADEAEKLEPVNVYLYV